MMSQCWLTVSYDVNTLFRRRLSPVDQVETREGSIVSASLYSFVTQET